MFVRQLVGRYAGDVIDLPYAQARAALDNGTAERIDDIPTVTPVDAGLAPFVPDVSSDVLPVELRRPRGRSRKVESLL